MNQVVFVPSLLQRVLMVGLGMGMALIVVSEFREEPWVLVFGLLVPVLVLDGLRTKVVIDRDRGALRVTRAVMTTTVPLDAVIGIRVPSRGPVMVTLADPRAWVQVGWPGQVNTGFQTSTAGPGSFPRRLASALDVPLESQRRQYPPGEEPPPPRMGWVLGWAAAIVGTAAVAIIVAMAIF